MMKVLLVSPLPPPSGGIATWTQEVVEYFQERRGDVSVIVLNTALTGKRHSVVSNKRAIFDEVVRTKSILDKLRQLLKSQRFDVVHINTAGAQFGMYRDALIAKTIKERGILTVLQFRCNVKDQAEYNGISQIGFSRLIKFADRILVLNKASLEYIKEKTAVPSNIVPNFTVMPVLSEQKPINKSLKDVIFVGQVRRDKGVDELFEMAKRFEDIKFHLYGNVYEEYKNVNIPKNVILCGNTDKDGIKKALDDADVFVLPSYTEGFSNALVEAMARGVPCIATDVGANKEMLADDCGVCVPVRNIDALVKALEIMKSAEVRTRYSRKSLNRCIELYTCYQVCETLVNEWRM